MTAKLYDEIPSVDLNDFLSGDADKKQQFVNKLGEAYNNIGFVAVKNHGLSNELSDKLYESVKSFFNLSDELKHSYIVPGIGGQRGYTAKGKEHAKGRNVGDLKEFYHVGQQLDDEELKKLGYPKNIFPQEVPGFEKNTIKAYNILLETGMQMLRAIALYLGLDEFYFDDKVKYGNSILRQIHYYPISNPDDVPEGAVRAAAHEDINLITLLMGASADGLQVLRKDGKWIPVTALPGQIIVNVGDMLDRLSNKKLKSTTHRVVNPPKELMHTSRYSIPFFLHPVSEMDLSCLPSCVNDENPKQYKDITAGEFLHQRLREIGLI
jgi:isopenicillin N synthase-like dioxygenase